jgi:hypothetical protein
LFEDHLELNALVAHVADRGATDAEVRRARTWRCICCARGARQVLVGVIATCRIVALAVVCAGPQSQFNCIRGGEQEACKTQTPISAQAGPDDARNARGHLN